MAVKIQIDSSAVETKVTTAWNKGLALLSEEILGDCNRYVKVRDHPLEQSSIIHSVPKQGKLVWQTPYARRQYWEIRTAIKDVNPNASWRWCEVAKTRHKGDWERMAQRLLEMNL